MDIDTMEQKGRRRKSSAAHDMPRRLVGSKCVDQRVPVYWDQTVPVWPFANSPAATKLPARNPDAATEASSPHCCCINSSRSPRQCNAASSFQLVPSASPAGTMNVEDQSARASNSAVCNNNNNKIIFDPPPSTSTSEIHQVGHPTILLIRSWKWIPGVAANIPCTTVVSKSLPMLPMH